MMESTPEIQKTNRMSPGNYCLSPQACPVWDKEEGRLGEILEDDLQLSDIGFSWLLLLSEAGVCSICLCFMDEHRASTTWT